jgi:hypothetical protein
MIDVFIGVSTRQCLDNLTATAEYFIRIPASIPDEPLVKIANAWINEMNEC